jgi:hypothetical protein
MPIHSWCIRKPANPTPRNFVPENSRAYRVRDGDNWQSVSSIAEQNTQSSIGAWGVIRFNFPNLPADDQIASLEVNWYLENYVGCRRLTADQRNYVFSSADSPGTIYLPTSAYIQPMVPLLKTIAERRQSINANTPGRIVIEEDSAAQAKTDPFYAISSYEEVTENTKLIKLAASRYGLNENFLKAIVYIESTHGWYDRLEGSHNKTIRPMNVHDELWSGMGIDRKTLLDKQYNIMAGAHLLWALWERVEDPSYEKVAQLYNQLGATKVGRYGKTVDRYRRERPWLSNSKKNRL